MPGPGGYWLSPSRIAATAASRTSGGPSVSGKPWPRLTLPVAMASADISAKIVVPKPCSLAVRYGSRALGTTSSVGVARPTVSSSADRHRALHAVVDLAHHRVGAGARQGERGRRALVG